MRISRDKLNKLAHVSALIALPAAYSATGTCAAPHAIGSVMRSP